MNTTPISIPSYELPSHAAPSGSISVVTPASPIPDAFLSELTRCIGAHLHDPALCLPKLLRLSGMSRSDLHRKLKTATGMSATEYIRHLRLQRSARLLVEQPDWSILYIALEVGFNDHSYFTKRFREVHGVSPATFRIARQKLEHTL